MKTFRIWHKTQFGIGFELKKAKTIEDIKLPKRLSLRLIEIEEI